MEALQRISYTEYLLDIWLYGEIEEKAALIAAQGKEVLRLEQRISELAAGNAGSGKKDDGHNGTCLLYTSLARQFFPDGDYKIYLDSEMTEEKVMAAGNPLNEELKQEILSIDGVTDIIPSRQSLHATYKTEIHQAGGMCDMLTDQNYAVVEAALTEGTMPTDSRSLVIDYTVLKQNEDMGCLLYTSRCV